MIILLILILFIVLAENLAMTSIRESVEHNSLLYYLLGVLFYAAVCLFLRMSFKMNGMGLVNTLWSSLSVITVALIGKTVFDEKLNSLQWLAVGLASLAALIMAGSGDGEKIKTI